MNLGCKVVCEISWLFIVNFYSQPIRSKNKKMKLFQCKKILIFLFLILLSTVGCGSSSKHLKRPSYNSSAGQDAIKQYDKDGDGFIGGEELEAVPGLQASKSQIDANGDGKLSPQEINDWIEDWKRTKINGISAAVQITLDGTPLEGALVEFEPEAFVGTNLPSGTGTSSADGWAIISTSKDPSEGPKIPGMPLAWYKIRVTHPSKSIPSKYNTETTLGCEVGTGSDWLNEGSIKLDLKSQ